MKFQSDLDYVIFYAEQMLFNKMLFEKQRIFLESQFLASRTLFNKMKGDNFKKFARGYLLSRGLI